MSKRFIPIILIVTLMVDSFAFVLISEPVYAADATQNTAEFTGCVGGNLLAAGLSNMISKVKGTIVRKVTQALSVPVVDSGTQDLVDTGNWSYLNKAYITDAIARCTARQILSIMTGNIYQIMRTAGRDGGVPFVKNWSNFLTQSQYRGENIFRAELSTAKLCDYLSKDVKKVFGVDPNKQIRIPSNQNTRSDSLQPFNLATNCTLPAGFTMEKYQKDFAGNGGWEAFSRLLEPQNNISGLAALSLDEIAKQRALQQAADTSQAIAGQGYTGISGTNETDSCLIKNPSGRGCAFYKDIKTTGSYIASSVGASVAAELTWLTSAQSLGSIIANLTQVLLNRMLNEGSPNEGTAKVDNSGQIINDGLQTEVPGVPPPKDALTKHPSQVAVVASVKAQLKSEGNLFSTECEVFEIIKRVTWQLKGDSAGLLKKPTGENICSGFSVSRIIYNDGYMYKILSSAGPDDGSGTGNGPQWVPEGCGPVGGNGTCIDRYAPAIDPAVPAPIPPGPATPPELPIPQ